MFFKEGFLDSNSKIINHTNFDNQMPGMSFFIDRIYLQRNALQRKMLLFSTCHNEKLIKQKNEKNMLIFMSMTARRKSNKRNSVYYLWLCALSNVNAL